MATAEKILVITGDPLVEELIGASIRAHPDWQHCLLETSSSLRKALAEISVAHFQIILVDCSSFPNPPVEILIQLRGANRLTPLILINRPGMEKTAINCLKHGADYYLIKNKGWEVEIPSILQTVLLEHQQKNSLKKKLNHLEQENKRLKGNVAFDEETLFYSSQHFQSVLARECDRANRYGLNLACLLLEVREGNGPNFYENMALKLKAILRTSDIWARVHEDRFAALLPHTTSQQARHAIKRIDTEIGGWHPAPKIRWGVAHFDKDKVKNEKEFLDVALASLKTR